MATPQEKVQCASWFIETKSDVKYRTKYERDPPSGPLIHRWHKKFIETGSVLDTVRNGRPRTSGEIVLSLEEYSHFEKL